MEKWTTSLIFCCFLAPLSCTTGPAAPDQKPDETIASLQDEIQKPKEEQKELKKERDLLAKKIEELEKTIKHLKDRLQPFPQPDPTPPSEPATIKGAILAIEGEYAMLSVGKDEGVQPWMVFSVMRNEKSIGTLIVRNVYADSSGAEFLKRGKNSDIREGDVVVWNKENPER